MAASPAPSPPILPSNTRFAPSRRLFPAQLPSGVETRTGPLRDPAFVADALDGVDLVLHLAPLLSPSAPDDADTVLDEAGRGTYVLLDQALSAGVRRFVLGSTLDLFDRLPAHWKVNEDWRPRPTPTLHQLSPWLAELSVRESVRTVPGARALCLRFGQIVDDS
jgi:nucleoside-diphosphate-sugar epimerase